MANSWARPQLAKRRQIIASLLEKFPETGSRTLARMLHEKHPVMFDTLEKARSSVRAFLGNSGEVHRKTAEKRGTARAARKPGELPPLPKSEAKPWEPFVLEAKRVLVLSDLHIPHSDEVAVDAALHYGDEFNPDAILLNGDLLDCVVPETRVLRSDLRWVRADSLRAGDELIGFDEHPVGLKTSGRSVSRKMRRCTVECAVVAPQPLLALQMDDGTILRCTPNHRWLGWKSTKNRAVLEWMSAAEIRERVQQGRPVLLNKPVNPWEDEPRDFDSGYVAAAFDGEGHVTFHYNSNNFGHLAFSQRPNYFMDRVERILQNRGFSTSRQKGGGSAGTLQVMGGMWSHAEFIGRFDIPRFKEKWAERAPIDGYQLYGQKRSRVVSVDDAGTGDIVALQTSSRTYLAEGFCSHNCYHISRFDKDPTVPKVKHELSCVNQFFCHIAARFPGAGIYYKLGNHDERMDKYLMLNAPELFDIPEIRYAWHGPAGITANNVTVIDDQRKVMLGKLMVLHGHEKGKGISNPVNPARGAFLRLLTSSLEGHSHQQSEHTERGADGRTIVCRSTGCLCDLQPPYARFNRWSQGFATVVVESNGDYHVKLHRIIDGKVL